MPSYIFNPEQTVGEILPTSYINRITLSGEDSELGVEVQVSVKDVIGRGGENQWINASVEVNGKPFSIKDYIKIEVLETTTEAATNAFSEIIFANDFDGITFKPQILNNPTLRTGTSNFVFDLSEIDTNNPNSKVRTYGDDGKSVISTTYTIPHIKFLPLLIVTGKQN